MFYHRFKLALYYLCIYHIRHYMIRCLRISKFSCRIRIDRVNDHFTLIFEQGSKFRSSVLSVHSVDGSKYCDPFFGLIFSIHLMKRRIHKTFYHTSASDRDSWCVYANLESISRCFSSNYLQILNLEIAPIHFLYSIYLFSNRVFENFEIRME